MAIGARTPVGLSAMASAAAFRAGIRRTDEHPFMIDLGGEPIRMGLDGLLDPRQMGAVRLVVMARSALKEALSALDLSRVGRVEVLLALPEARPGFTDANAKWVAGEVAAGLLPRPVELAARGHAGALDALRDAAERIEDGRSELCAVVGVDSYVAPATVDWLVEQRRTVGEANRDGFIPGEAAGCVVVASPSHSFTRLAWIRGAHSAREKVLIRDDAEVLGHGLTEAIRGAMASLRLPEEAIDDVYCDLNGERYRTDEWSLAILRVGATLRTVQYVMPAECWGDVGAASGALGCVMATHAWMPRPTRGLSSPHAKGPRALVWAGSESGLRSAVVLARASGGLE